MACSQDVYLRKWLSDCKIHDIDFRSAQLACEQAGWQSQLRRGHFRATKQALGIIELLEAILLHLPSWDVVRVRRAHPIFKSTIDGSPTLRQHLNFSKPRAASRYLSWTHWDGPQCDAMITNHRPTTSGHSGQIPKFVALSALHPALEMMTAQASSIDSWTPDSWASDQDLDCMDIRIRFYVNLHTISRWPEGEWRNAFLMNPPCKHLTAKRFGARHEGGLTFGDLFFALEQSEECFPGSDYDADDGFWMFTFEFIRDCGKKVEEARARGGRR